MWIVLFSCFAGSLDMALLFWVSAGASGLAILVEILTLLAFIGKPAHWGLALILWFSSGFWVFHYYMTVRDHQLPLSWQNQPLQAEGQIVSPVYFDPLKQAFLFQLSCLCLIKKPSLPCQKTAALISVKRYQSTGQTAPEFKPGQFWRFSLRLKRSHHWANPGFFKPLDWASGYYAEGTLLAKPKMIQLKQGHWLFNVDLLRQNLDRRLMQLIDQPQSLALITALTLGIRSHLSPELWMLFQHTGTLHLMAISGLHIGLVALFAYGFVVLFWVCCPGFFQFWPRPRIAGVVAILAVWGYGALAGFAVSTLRACLMLSLYGLSRSLNRRLSWSTVLLFSAVAISLYDPLELLSKSFWLSFIAVGSIAFLVWNGPKDLSKIQNHIFMQMALSLCLAPFSIIFFQQLPMNAMLSNWIAIPWVSWIILPFSLLGLMVLGVSSEATKIIVHFLNWNIGGLLYVLNHIVHYFPAMIWGTGVNALGWALLSACFFLILLARAWELKMIALLWFCLALSLKHPLVPQGAVRITVLDVGQGLSLLVETQHHSLLYDTGPAFYGGGDVATVAILPFLRWQGVSKLDAVIVSHQDADHSGGLASILKQIPVHSLISSSSQSPFTKHLYQDPRFRQQALFYPQKTLKIGYCLSGEHWIWDGVYFTVLGPDPLYQPVKGNNLSCVLSVRAGKHRILLPGDIEQTAEIRLVQEAPDLLASEVLVAAHHGSQTSSSAEFLEQVAPKRVIFSTGYLNRYHFPALKIVKSYHDRGILEYNTARDGAISLIFYSDDRPSLISSVRGSSLDSPIAAFWKRNLNSER